MLYRETHEQAIEVGGTWSLGEYEKLLGELATQYTFGTSEILMSPSEDVHPNLWLRHDIEVSTEPAIRMAKLEQVLGVHATYLICVQSPLIEEVDAKDLAVRLKELNHEVGLHLVCQADSTRETLIYDRAYYASALGIAADCPVSLHHPSERDATKLSELCPTPEVYDSYTVNGWSYCSDSTGKWRYGSPLTIAEPRQSLQLLVHPVWWSDPVEADVHELSRLMPQYADLA